MTRPASDHRERLGFRDGDRGTHSSRTLMLGELDNLLGAAPPDAPRSRLRELIVDENLLGKRSAGNRLSSFKHLSELYALDVAVPVYRLMRRLWEADAEGRLLLALMCAVARDPLLRGAASVVLDAASLFGFVQVSDLVPRVVSHLSGRLLVFFPGSREGNVYKLLDAREGWNYLATPITAFDDGSAP